MNSLINPLGSGGGVGLVCSPREPAVVGSIRFPHVFLLQVREFARSDKLTNGSSFSSFSVFWLYKVNKWSLSVSIHSPCWNQSISKIVALRGGRKIISQFIFQLISSPGVCRNWVEHDRDGAAVSHVHEVLPQSLAVHPAFEVAGRDDDGRVGAALDGHGLGQLDGLTSWLAAGSGQNEFVTSGEFSNLRPISIKLIWRSWVWILS